MDASRIKTVEVCSNLERKARKLAEQELKKQGAVFVQVFSYPHGTATAPPQCGPLSASYRPTDGLCCRLPHGRNTRPQHQTHWDGDTPQERSKIFFPDKSFDLADVGEAIVSIAKELDTFGFLTGEMVKRTSLLDGAAHSPPTIASLMDGVLCASDRRGCQYKCHDRMAIFCYQHQMILKQKTAVAVYIVQSFLFHDNHSFTTIFRYCIIYHVITMIAILKKGGQPYVSHNPICCKRVASSARLFWRVSSFDEQPSQRNAISHSASTVCGGEGYPYPKRTGSS